jgi:hypothetical protein
MTTPEQQREWLRLLEEELTRRATRVAREADEDERQRQWFFNELQQIAERLGAPLPGHPLDISDMSIAELLSCRLFLPEHLQPAGLPTEDEIWARFEALKAGSPPG